MTQAILITGASRGIGFATAQLFAEKGWNVAICSRDENQVRRASEKIAKSTNNKNVAGFKADIGDASSTDHLFELVKNRFGGLDALVNNAAVIHTGDVFKLSDADFADMMRINVIGLARCSRHAFKLMKRNGGSIVNISSVAGIPFVDKFPGFWGYTATKFAVCGLTEALAVEGKPYKIRVNGIAPGATETDMLKKAAPSLKADAQPEDIAKIAYYLCDKEQSGILSGTIIPVLSTL